MTAQPDEIVTPSHTAGSLVLLGITMAEARELVRDIARHRPWMYWTDLVVCLTVGYSAFLAVPVHRLWSLPALTFMAVSSFALYRSVIFVHEIVHAPPGSLNWFRFGWHVLCGIPMLVPSFLYEFHLDHHRARTYGTRRDGEYVAFASGPRWRVTTAPLTALLGMPAFVARFLVLAPLSWAVPRVRPFVLSRASALAIDAEFSRPLPAVPMQRRWVIQEALCFGYCVAVLGFVMDGLIQPMRLAEAYIVVTLLLFVNWLRVLGAHRYGGRRERMSFAEQVLDSIDHTSFGPIAELWAPLGLRYHAVHHLLPWLPYHALPEARRRLLRTLPANAGFRWTEHRRLTSTIAQLLRRERPAAVKTLASR